MATNKSSSYFDKIESDIKSNQSTLNLILGALIVVVVGVLAFNYFNKNNTPDLGPAEQTEQMDVSPDNLPGKYTIKEGDTLFSIAQKYYQDGYQYTEIATANKLENPNTIEVDQVLEIPKLEETALASPAASAQLDQSPTPAVGGGNTTIWGAKIEGDSYTVVEGDWLSTIAARAYGDIMAYGKIAKANNIADPNVIEIGMQLELPR